MTSYSAFPWFILYMYFLFDYPKGRQLIFCFINTGFISCLPCLPKECFSMYEQETSFQLSSMHTETVLFFHIFILMGFLHIWQVSCPCPKTSGRLKQTAKFFSEQRGTCKSATLQWQDHKGLWLCTGTNAGHTEDSAKILLAQRPYNVHCEKLQTKGIYCITV